MSAKWKYSYWVHHPLANVDPNSSIKQPVKYTKNISKANQTYMPQSISDFEVKSHLGANLIEIFFDIENDETSTMND